jgi:hypothetical protein
VDRIEGVKFMSAASLFALLPLMPAAPPWKALYAPREAEAILGISHATCYRLINDGRLDARKLNGKTCIIAESIRSLIDNLPKIGGVL